MHKKVDQVQPATLLPKGNIVSRNTKYHPKTLAIPSTTMSTSTTTMISSTKKMIFANGNGTGDKRSSVPSTVAAHNRTSSPSPRRGRGQQKLQQSQKICPVSANSTSSSSSMTSSYSSSGAIYSTQLASICREVALVRDEHVAIRNTLSEKEGELGKTKVALRNLAEERDQLRNKVSELEQIVKHSSQKCSHAGGLVTNQNHSTIMSTMATSASYPMPPQGNPSYINNSNINSNRSNNNNKLLSMGRHSSLSSATIIPSHNHIPQEQGNCVISSRGSTLQQTQKQTGSRSWPDQVPFPSSPSPSPVIGNRGMRSTHNGNGSLDGMLQMAENSPHSVSLSNMFCSQPSSISNINSREAHQMTNNSGNNNNPSHSQNGRYHNEQQDKMGHAAQSGISTTSFEVLERNGNRLDNENGNDVVLQTGMSGGTSGNCHENEARQMGNESRHQHHHLSQSGISGLDLMLLGPDCSTKVVEHLVHPWTIQSSVREIEHRMVVQGSPMSGEGVREVEIEVDRLNSRIDHLRSQNDVLTLNLEDAKGHADRLTELLWKYESNNVALQLALRYSDQMTGAYEVLVTLLETEMGQVLANLHARGQLKAICSLPSPNNNNISTGSIMPTKSASVSRSSGNNNNSNDNCPSEQVPPVKGNNGNTSNSGSVNDVVGGNKTQEANNQMVIPTAIGGIPDKLPLRCPSSSGVSSSSPSPKSTDLIEQAGRNRMVAERAARFLLSRFSPASTSAPGFGTNSKFANANYDSCHPLQHHLNIQSETTCTPSSTPGMLSSSTSANSNLSNMSGESVHLSDSSFSPEDMKDPSSVIVTAKNSDRPVQPSSTTEVPTMMAMMMTTTCRSSGGSPATSTTSSTFRAPSSSTSPLSPNGNEHPSGDHSSIIPLLLPYLEYASPLGARNNSSINGIQDISTTQSSPTSPVEPQIRNLISTLKAERDGVKGTVVKLESESLESMNPSPQPIRFPSIKGNDNNNISTATITARSPAECSKMDLETAVLMQELMAMKEERAEIRAQVFLLEKEKDSLELRVRSHENQNEAYMARINYLESEMQECKSFYSTTETTMDTYQQVPDNRNRNEMIIYSNQHQQQKNNANNRNLETAIINNNNNNQNGNREREALLKKRIHELASTLERVAMGSQLREKDNEEMINELNRANGFLMQTLEASKKKYQNRIKKMEDQILYVSERHAAQLKLFGMAGNGTGTRSPGMGNYHR